MFIIIIIIIIAAVIFKKHRHSRMALIKCSDVTCESISHFIMLFVAGMMLIQHPDIPMQDLVSQCKCYYCCELLAILGGFSARQISITRLFSVYRRFKNIQLFTFSSRNKFKEGVVGAGAGGD